MAKPLLIAAAVFAVAAGGAHAAEDYVLHVMKGRLAAVDELHRTVVVEVPWGDEQYTVGGPLVSGAILLRNGRKARLEDFRVGERVTVRWRSTGRGHIIEVLAAP